MPFCPGEEFEQFFRVVVGSALKKRLQGDVAQEKYKSMPETYSTLMKEGGVGRFFTGWGWRTGRMICAIFIMGQCKDRFAPIFYPHHFRKGGDRA